MFIIMLLLKLVIYFFLYSDLCGDMFVIDMFDNLFLVMKFLLFMFIFVESLKVLIFVMGYFVLFNVKVKDNIWNLMLVFMFLVFVCFMFFKMK